MNRRTVILWTLGVGQLLIWAIALRLAETAIREGFAAPCMAIVYGQFYLTGVWIAAAKRSIRWRLVVVAACLTRLTWVQGEGFTDMSGLTLVLGPGIVATLLPLLLACAFGLRFHDQEPETQPSNPVRFQFSLRSILEWTAVVAILFSLAAIVHPDVMVELRRLGLEDAAMLPLIHGPFAAICLAEMAAILSMRRPWIGLALLLPVGLAVGSWLGWMFGDDTAEVPALVVCLMLWFAISFLPLRLLGYRFGRRRTVDAGAAAPTKPPPG